MIAPKSTNGLSYKSYVAKITLRDCMAPSAEVIKNDFTGAISFAYNDVGDFFINNSMSEFIPGKLAIFEQNIADDGAWNRWAFAVGDPQQIQVWVIGTDNRGTDLGFCYLEIRAYS